MIRLNNFVLDFFSSFESTEKFSTINISKKRFPFRTFLWPNSNRNNIFDRMIRRANFSYFCTNTSVIQKNSLKRQTIDSKHISTISSIVDKTEFESNHNRRVDHQRCNFGLYALKFNRSEAKRQSSIHRPSITSHRKYLNENKQISIASDGLKHEQFKPCQVNDDLISDEDYAKMIEKGEFYRIELDPKMDAHLKQTEIGRQITNDDGYITRNTNKMTRQRVKKKVAPIPTKTIVTRNTLMQDVRANPKISMRIISEC